MVHNPVSYIRFINCGGILGRRNKKEGKKFNGILGLEGEKKEVYSLILLATYYRCRHISHIPRGWGEARLST